MPKVRGGVNLFKAVIEKDRTVKIPFDLYKGLGLKEGDIVNLEFVREGKGPRPTKELEAELGYAQDYEVSVNTLKFFLPIWLKNFKENLPYFVKDARSFAMIPPAEGDKKWCVVVANGPSLYETDLSPLKSFNGTIICANKPLAHLLENGIVPDWVTALDAQEVVAESFEKDIVREHAHRLKALLPTTIHPRVAKFCVDHMGIENVYWSNPVFSDEVAPNVSETLTSITNIPACQHGGNTGTFSYLMAIKPLLCRPIGLLGFDMSYKPNPKWSLAEASQYRYFYLPHKNSFYAMTPPFEYYIARLIDLWEHAMDLGVITWNLTPVGPLNAVVTMRSTTLEQFCARRPSEGGA